MICIYIMDSNRWNDLFTYHNIKNNYTEPYLILVANLNQELYVFSAELFMMKILMCFGGFRAQIYIWAQVSFSEEGKGEVIEGNLVNKEFFERICGILGKYFRKPSMVK
jgi:hypothetical protein